MKVKLSVRQGGEQEENQLVGRAASVTVRVNVSHCEGHR